MTENSLIVLSIAEFGYLLYLVDELPYSEARALEAELKETYAQSMEKPHEPKNVADRIRYRRS